MYGLVKIGEREIPMQSMASVDIYFKHIFGYDPIRLQASEEFANNEGERVDLCLKMGFVMAKFVELKADRAKLNALNEDSFVEWLDTFEREDLLAATLDMWLIYNGQKKKESKPKKSQGQ